MKNVLPKLGLTASIIFVLFDGVPSLRFFL